MGFPINFVESYINWLNANINLKKIDDWIEINTPFLDNHNDHLQIYVKAIGNKKYILTDDGYIISNLILSGCDLSTSKRKDILELIIKRFGINLDNDALIIETTEEDFPQKKHMLLQAMMSVSDMFMLTRSKVVNIFLEEIETFFDYNEIRYISSVQFNGISGFTHLFDFAIPKTKNNPERLLKAINNPTRSKAESALFAWDDVKKTRKTDSRFLVLLNDTEKNIESNIIKAFERYNVGVIPWSERDRHLDKLIA